LPLWAARAAPASSRSLSSAMTAKPFTRPKPPEKGDPTADAIFLAVGRALSEWETTEQVFARLYGIIVAPGGNITASGQVPIRRPVWTSVIVMFFAPIVMEIRAWKPPGASV
jgi:hypothetical protein